MSQLHLPAQHTDHDLVLAGAVATLLESAELYVAWSTDGGAAKPMVAAELQPPAAARAPRRRSARAVIARLAGLMRPWAGRAAVR